MATLLLNYSSPTKPTQPMLPCASSGQLTTALQLCHRLGQDPRMLMETATQTPPVGPTSFSSPYTHKPTTREAWPCDTCVRYCFLHSLSPLNGRERGVPFELPVCGASAGALVVPRPTRLN